MRTMSRERRNRASSAKDSCAAISVAVLISLVANARMVFARWRAPTHAPNIFGCDMNSRAPGQAIS